MARRQVEEHKWWTLTAVCVATFMLLIDITIVNVALPDISKSLHSTFSDLQWVIDAYALGLAALLLTWGSTSDRLGRRFIFVVGLGIFSAASLCCALSTTPLMLNLARAVQGVGGAAMFATSLALLASAFQGRERGTAVGIWGATIGAAVAIGPLVGGVLTEGIGWEAIFYVNIPIGIGAIYISLTRVAESKDPNAGPTDWVGLVSFSVSLFLLIFALVRGNPEGWGSTLIVSFLVGAVVLMVIFVIVESRIRYPMFDLALFRVPTFTGACIAAFALSASMFSLFLYLTLYIQNGLGYSPLQAGLRFLPLSLLSFFVAPIAGRLSARVPIRLLMGSGMALVGVAILLMRGLTASSGWTALLAGFIVAGIGVALVNAPLASTAVSVVPPERAGMGSGINSTFRQVGIATGTAGLGALFQHLLSSRAEGPLARVPAEALAQGRPPIPGAAAHHAYLALFTDALNDLFLVAAIVAFAGAALSFALIRQRDFAAVEAGAPPAAAPATEEPEVEAA
jgi:EmrB/QacA subfamily drug resistance transporter